MFVLNRGLISLVTALKTVLKCDSALIGEIDDVARVARDRGWNLDRAWIVPIVADPIHPGALVKVRNIEVEIVPWIGKTMMVDVNREATLSDLITSVRAAIESYDDIDAWLHNCSSIGAFVARLSDVDYEGVLLWVALAVER